MVRLVGLHQQDKMDILMERTFIDAINIKEYTKKYKNTPFHDIVGRFGEKRKKEMKTLFHLNISKQERLMSRRLKFQGGTKN